MITLAKKSLGCKKTFLMNLIILRILPLSDTENFNNTGKKKKPTEFRRPETFSNRKTLRSCNCCIGIGTIFIIDCNEASFSRNSEQGAETEGCLMAFGWKNIVKWAEADSCGH